MNCYTTTWKTGTACRAEEPLPQVPEQHIVTMWLDRLQETREYMSLEGHTVRVLNPGTINLYDGPDFQGAMVELNGELHAGAIEIHRRIEDWYLHNHQQNVLYRSVILHVLLYPPDGPVPEGLPPTVVLTAGMTAAQRRLATLHKKQTGVFHACIESSPPVPHQVAAALILAAETRFTRKRTLITDRMASLSGTRSTTADWMQCFYELLARSLGYGGNADALQQFAADVPLVLLRSLQASNTSLRDGEEVLHNLAASRAWRAKSVRPGNRIQKRLAHLAVVLPAVLRPGSLYDILECVLGLHGKEAHEAVDVWCQGASRTIGRERSYEIAINVFAPFAVAYAELHGRTDVMAAALRLYFDTPNPPFNRHIRTWKAQFGLPEHLTSGMQQGIIELRTQKCHTRACDYCLLSSALS